MNKMIRFHLWHLMLWGIVSIGAGWLLISSRLINHWQQQPSTTLALALLFAGGYGGEAWLRFRYREKAGSIIKDERDEAIRLKGVETALVVVLIYVFVMTIGIYLGYEREMMVPAGWLWIIAFSLAPVANLSVSISVLIRYHKENRT